MIAIPKIRRSWFQYSLRSLFILTLFVAIACSFLAVKMRKAENQAYAVKSLRELGWVMLYDYQVVAMRCNPPKPNPTPYGPAWMRRLFGDDFFNNAVYANGFADAHAEYLDNLPKLEFLFLHAHEGGSSIGKTPPTNAIFDDALQHVKKLTQLKILQLDHLGISDAGLENLAGLTQLERLDLVTPNITGDGLKYLTGLTRLGQLRLYAPKVTDAKIKNLAALTSLKELALHTPNVTDDGLEHLKTLKQLKDLDVFKTKISKAGVEKLSQALPNCKISAAPKGMGTSEDKVNGK
jgi:hypothetical protein